jgi:hypothetical protein
LSKAVNFVIGRKISFSSSEYARKLIKQVNKPEKLNQYIKHCMYININIIKNVLRYQRCNQRAKIKEGQEIQLPIKSVRRKDQIMMDNTRYRKQKI